MPLLSGDEAMTAERLPWVWRPRGIASLAVVVVVALLVGLRLAGPQAPHPGPLHEFLGVNVINNSSSDVSFLLIVSKPDGQVVLNRSLIVDKDEVWREFVFQVPDGFYNLSFIVDERRNATVQIEVGPGQGPVVFRATDASLFYLGQDLY